jgi:superfamily I DNA/RNA helicase
MNLPRNLINEGGEVFGDELAELQEALEALDSEARRLYRDQNAAAIASHSATRMLVVAGPGAGKSHLFMDRIKHWLPVNADASIHVASFVRKLVKDLEHDVQTSDALADEGRERVTVSTLHTAARSLLERNHGTEAQPFKAHMKVISGEWEETVWQDVLMFHPKLNASRYSHRSFARQFHTEEFDDSEEWPAVRDTYARLTRFYNAVGFPDMIVLARQALEQDPELNRDLLWIIDEFQDFNHAEEHLIRAIVETARAVLIAGDDEQALYQLLKSSLPEIIISYYADPDYVNAMLPYCSRCSYHNCLAASAFIAKHRVGDAIAKIYLPLKCDEADPRVQLVATWNPAAAVDYIEKFMDDHQEEFKQYVEKMEAGEESDPFLLILTPDKELKFYKTGGAGDRLRDLVRQWSGIKLGRSGDYWRTATYAAVAWDPGDNLSTRKVLAHEDVDIDVVHDLLVTALDESRTLADVVSAKHSAILTKCKEVADALESNDLDDTQQVAAIKKVFPVANSAQLVDELVAHPLKRREMLTDEGEEALEIGAVGAPVELLSLYAAKGLSAQHVIVLGCDDVNMKRIRPLTFFVALTRARKSLHLLVSAKAGGATAPHPFLFDLPAECCEYKVYKKTGRVTEPLKDTKALKKKMASWQWRR